MGAAAERRYRAMLDFALPALERQRIRQRDEALQLAVEKWQQDTAAAEAAVKTAETAVKDRTFA